MKNGFSKEHILKFLNKCKKRKPNFILIEFAEENDLEEKFAVGSIISIKDIDYVIDSVEKDCVKKVIGLDFTDGLSDCPGSRFSIPFKE